MLAVTAKVDYLKILPNRLTDNEVSDVASLQFVNRNIEPNIGHLGGPGNHMLK